MARREDFDPDEEYGRYDKFSRRSDWMSWRARLLYGAGLVLCPIFEPVKHRNYREYSERMAAARMTYRGIAADSRLRFEFAKRVESIIEIGSFDSLDKAAGSGLPERLALNSESRGGTFA